MNLNTVMIAAADRGLSGSDCREMTLGEIVDYIVEYNETHKIDTNGTGGDEPARNATQADWDAFFG